MNEIDSVSSGQVRSRQVGQVRSCLSCQVRLLRLAQVSSGLFRLFGGCQVGKVGQVSLDHVNLIHSREAGQIRLRRSGQFGSV